MVETLSNDTGMQCNVRKSLYKISGQNIDGRWHIKYFFFGGDGSGCVTEFFAHENGKERIKRMYTTLAHEETEIVSDWCYVQTLMSHVE